MNLSLFSCIVTLFMFFYLGSELLYSCSLLSLNSYSSLYSLPLAVNPSLLILDLLQSSDFFLILPILSF